MYKRVVIESRRRGVLLWRGCSNHHLIYIKSKSSKRIDRQGPETEGYTTFWQNFATRKWATKWNKENQHSLNTQNNFDLTNMNMEDKSKQQDIVLAAILRKCLRITWKFRSWKEETFTEPTIEGVVNRCAGRKEMSFKDCRCVNWK